MGVETRDWRVYTKDSTLRRPKHRWKRKQAPLLLASKSIHLTQASRLVLALELRE